MALLAWRHRATKANKRLRLRPATAMALLVSAVLLVLLYPQTGTADEPPEGLPGLPDLISDRSFIWHERVVVSETDGSQQRVLTFDGYLHNVGEGSLDLLGNPQIPGDVVQRVYDGDRWNVVESENTPTIRYETTDGHNHFHIIGISEYALFDESRRTEIGESAKIGFCLIDTEQVEEITDAFYEIDRYQYCGVDDPAATELRMGISPGWRDTYDASTTLQWVDVSTTAPGKYWIAARTDPRNEIVESNEDNNGLTFSLNTFNVAGYTPALAPPQTITAPNQPIKLGAHVIGAVGAPTWTITAGPTSGHLDVPLGVALATNTVRYTPDPGFTGSDTFEWQVRDSSRTFPHVAETAITQIEVPELIADAENDGSATDGPDARTAESIDMTATEFEYVETAVATDLDLAATNITWYGKNLPAGLRVDADTGLVSGTPTARGTYNSEVVAWNGTTVATQDISWVIAAEDRDSGVRSMNNLTSTLGERDDVFLGKRHPGATYEATGVPPGINSVSNFPWLSGKPTEVGTYDITLSELVDGEVRSTTQFEWVVRAAAIPAFPL